MIVQLWLAYYEKFVDQYSNQAPIRLFLFLVVINVVCIIRTQQGFFRWFLLAAANSNTLYLLRHIHDLAGFA